MKIDKFGIGALLVGLIILLVTFYFGFMLPGVTITAALIAAVITAIIGGLLLLGVLLIVIGILLLVL